MSAWSWSCCSSPLGSLLAWQTALVLRAGLWLSGHDEVSFDHLRVGVRELELTGLRIGDPSGPRLAELRIRYRPQMLLRRQLEEVAVRGLILQGELDEDGLQPERAGGHGRHGQTTRRCCRRCPCRSGSRSGMPGSS